MNEPFTISVYHNSKDLLLTCERIYQSENIERYKIAIKDRSIIVENNRPAVRLAGKNSHKFKWVMREGPVTVEFDFLRRLFTALEKWIEDIDEGSYQSRNEFNKFSRKNRADNN